MATLLDMGTPTPALALANGGTSTALGDDLTTYGASAQVPVTTSPTNIDSISLTVGTWVVISLVVLGDNAGTAYLSAASAVASNSWPVQTSGSFSTAPFVGVVAAKIKVATTTTVYVNAVAASGTSPNCNAMTRAIQI
jgi:hypothetical protein